MGRVRPLAFVDLDGVVADVRHRLHHVQRHPRDWDGFFAAAPQDAVHPEGVRCIAKLEGQGAEVAFLTGRPEHRRRDTTRWLSAKGFAGRVLHMRPSEDRRPAAEVKVELVEGLAAPDDVVQVVDDDPRVVEAMRAAGYPATRATWEPRSVGGQRALLAAQEREGRT